MPGIGLGQAFVGEIFAIGILTSLTALAALPGLGPVRRVLGAVLVAASYLAASYYAQGAFKETAEALFVLAVALALRDPAPLPAGAVGRLRYALPYLALAGGVLFAYSFAGLAWPIAVVALWSLTVPAVRRALAPRSLIRFLLRPTTLIVIALVAGIAVLTTVVGPFGFGTGFNRVAGSNTYGPVSPVEALGVWWSPNYRLDAPGESTLPWLAAAIGGAALAAGMIWWARRRDLSVPLAFAACALLYFVSLPFTGDYSQAKALMIGAPLAMLIAVRPLLAEFTRRTSGGRSSPSSSSAAPPTRASSSSATARSAPRDTAPSCGPSSRSCTGSRSSTRARIATPPMTCSAPTPTCHWSSSPIRRSRRTRKSRSTPATPTARSTSTRSRRRPSTASPT